MRSGRRKPVSGPAIVPWWLLRLVAEGEADPLEMAVFRSYVDAAVEPPPRWLLQQVQGIPHRAAMGKALVAWSPVP